MAKRSLQKNLFPKGESAYGGELMKTRKGRSTPRPLATRNTMHLVLRSSKAKGEWSFKAPRNRKKINEILQKFAAKNFVHIISLANVGNHLHLQIKLQKRELYRPFIRAITSAIAIAVAGKNWRQNAIGFAKDSRETPQTNGKSWRKNYVVRPAASGHVRGHDFGSNQIDESIAHRDDGQLAARGQYQATSKQKFWDYRPFTRVVMGFKAMLKLSDYIKINQIEGYGASREQAVWLLKRSLQFQKVYGVG